MLEQGDPDVDGQAGFEQGRLNWDGIASSNLVFTGRRTLGRDRPRPADRDPSFGRKVARSTYCQEAPALHSGSGCPASGADPEAGPAPSPRCRTLRGARQLPTSTRLFIGVHGRIRERRRLAERRKLMGKRIRYRALSDVSTLVQAKPILRSHSPKRGSERIGASSGSLLRAINPGSSPCQARAIAANARSGSRRQA